METIKLKAHIGSDGLLRIDLPTPMRAVDAEVVIIYNAQRSMTQEAWEAFVDSTYGSLADTPIERPGELPLDVRDEIE